MDMEQLKGVLTTIGWILLAIIGIVALFGLFIGMKWLYAWIAEQLGIPYVWVL